MQPPPSGAEEGVPPEPPDAAPAEPAPGDGAAAPEGTSAVLVETSGGGPNVHGAAGSEPAPPPPPGLGDDELPDEVMLKICSFLGVRELGRLACVSQRFAEKRIAAPSEGGGAAAALEMRRSRREAAKRWVAGRSEQERGWVSYRTTESWLRLMHEVEVLRLPLAFGRPGDFTLSENGAVATKSVNGGWRSAASKVVMRSGRHFAQFTAAEGGHMMFGVIQPGWDVEGGANADEVDGHCFYDT